MSLGRGGKAFVDNRNLGWRVSVAALGLAGLGLCGVSAKDSWTVPPQNAALPNPLATNSPVVVTMGKILYQDHCEDCHGSNGRGNGPTAADLSRQPPDFSGTKVQRESDGELFWKITEGHRPMPSFGKKLSEEQRWQLVCFLRALQSKAPLEKTPKDSKPTKPAKPKSS